MLLFKYNIFCILGQPSLNTFMKPYHLLDCPNLIQIQKETLDWIIQKTNLLTDPKMYWNKIDYIDFIKNSPALITYCKTLGLHLREAAILMATDHSGLRIHVDEKPITAKINFPILNTKDTYTEWYDIDVDTFPRTSNQFGQLVPNMFDININQYNKLAEIELQNPIVFNSTIPHQVRIGPTAQLPRIVLACMFFDEPINYLK